MSPAARRGAGAPARRRGRAATKSTRTKSTRTPLDGLRRAIDRHLGRTLAQHADPGGPLGKAIRYAALSPGKRLRPMLALTACGASGGRWQDALPAAAAIECVHAFSLVHDDLPAMDDDDYRRGRLTTHKKFGEALGVLTGDALLAFAFEELTRLPIARRDPARVVLAVRVLAEAAGARQLIQGQALDVAAEGRRTNRDDVADIHLRKTGALIAASLVLGGIAGGAPRAELLELHDLGLDLGLAFQIQDDLLNARSSLARLGKRAGTDAVRGKATWPGAVGVEQAAADAQALFASVLARVAARGKRARMLGLLIDQTLRRDS